MPRTPWSLRKCANAAIIFNAMSRIAYVNGRYVPHAYAMAPVEDRGMQFADGVYEVVEYFNQRPVDLDLHLARLKRSLQAVHIPKPMSDGALRTVLRQVIRRNHRQHGLLYVQINRGAGLRDHAFPKTAEPTVIVTAMPAKLPKPEVFAKGVKVITRPDPRWQRRDVKTVALLPNVLMKQQAADAGVREVLLTGEGGVVYEGSSCNAYMIDREGVLWTHPADEHVLPGVVRHRVLELATQLAIDVREEAFDEKMLMKAAEAFISSSSSHILPVIQVNEQPIGDGIPGPLTTKLLNAYHQLVQQQTGYACPTNV